jgi:uncharacterized protein YjbI with pentapeptide repeats
VPPEEAKDVEQILTAIQDAARTVSSRVVTFFTVGAYIALTIAATTDEMLVKGSAVQLPLLNTQIPITGWFGFYTIAPWLIVALHLDRMLQVSVLGSKLNELDRRTQDLDGGLRERIHGRLPTLPYVQFFAADARSRLQNILSGLIVGASMILFPLVLLCWIQVRFLALHDPVMTLSHRLALLVDIVLILLFLWPPLTLRDAQREREVRGTGSRRIPTRSLVLAACAVFLLLSLAARIPDDRRAATVWFRLRNLDLRERILTADKMSPESINALSDGDIGRREQALGGVSRQTFMQGRDLRHANLFHAVLPRLDLRSQREDGKIVGETDLQGADLQWAQMQQVLLDDANLRYANLSGAQLQGASLERTTLDEAILDDAQLQDARLPDAELRRASMRNAKLQAADLHGAILQQADLTGAQLQGANLRGARLQRADLSGASLQGADLSEAQLEGAKLRGASLQGSIIDGAFIGGADFADACLDFTMLAREKVGRCCEATECRSPDDEEYRDKRAAYLVEVACADPYAARGIAARALATKAADRKRLLAALAGASAMREKCAGVEQLPNGLARDLATAAAAPDRAQIAWLP